MQDQSTPFRAVLPLTSAGALVGLFTHVGMDSFGATAQSVSLPWGALLIALGATRVVRSSPPSQGIGRWLGVALSTILALASTFWTDLLARFAGWAMLPQLALPVLWLGFSAIALWAPSRRLDALRSHHGLVFALAVAAGLFLPTPVVALIAGASLVPVSRHAPGPLEPLAASDRVVQAGAICACVALGMHTLVVVQPSLDPSPAPLLGAAGMAALVLPLAALRAPLRAWHAWITVAVVAALLSFVLPHAIGVTRLTLLTTTDLLSAEWSPSIGTALAGSAIGGVFGLVAGSAIGRSGIRPEQPLAAALGLFIGTSAVGSSGAGPVALAAAFTGIAALFGSSRLLQISALLPGSLVALAIWRGATLPTDLLVLSPLDGLRSAERWAEHLDRPLELTAGTPQLTGRSVGTVLATPGDWSVAAQATDTLPFLADVSGRFSRPSGRAAEAEVLAGLLAGMLAPRLDRIVVLGDDAGNVLAGLVPSAPSAIDVATPVPTVIQDIARLAPSRRSRWLGPGLRLWPEHPEAVLRRTSPPAAVVDVVHAPWPDATH